MAQPVRFDIPHRLGRDEARRRMDKGLGDLDRAMPFASRIGKTWQGDRLVIEVTALGQVTTISYENTDTYKSGLPSGRFLEKMDCISQWQG